MLIVMLFCLDFQVFWGGGIFFFMLRNTSCDNVGSHVVKCKYILLFHVICVALTTVQCD